MTVPKLKSNLAMFRNIYSRWQPLRVDELMLLTSAASVISCVFHIQHTSPTTKSDAGPANHQPLALSRQDGCVCSETLLVLVHPKTTQVLYEQPSVVCLWTDNAYLVDQDEPGFERLSSTSSSTISASTWRGSVRRTIPSGVNSWRRLCHAKDAPPDDDDDDDDDNLKLGCSEWVEANSIYRYIVDTNEFAETRSCMRLDILDYKLMLLGLVLWDVSMCVVVRIREEAFAVQDKGHGLASQRFLYQHVYVQCCIRLYYLIDELPT